MKDYLTAIVEEARYYGANATAQPFVSKEYFRHLSR